MDSRGQVWGNWGGGGRGNGPAVLAHLPSAPSCLLHNKAAVSNCQMFTLPAHSPGIVALAGTHRRVELFYFIYYYLKKRDSRILCLGRSQAGLVLSAEIFHPSSVPGIIFVFFDTQPRYSHSKETG